MLLGWCWIEVVPPHDRRWQDTAGSEHEGPMGQGEEGGRERLGVRPGEF